MPVSVSSREFMGGGVKRMNNETSQLLCFLGGGGGAGRKGKWSGLESVNALILLMYMYGVILK